MTFININWITSSLKPICASFGFRIKLKPFTMAYKILNSLIPAHHSQPICLPSSLTKFICHTGLASTVDHATSSSPLVPVKAKCWASNALLSHLQLPASFSCVRFQAWTSSSTGGLSICMLSYNALFSSIALRKPTLQQVDFPMRVRVCSFVHHYINNTQAIVLYVAAF